MEAFQADWHLFEPHCRFSGATTLVLGDLEGYAVALLGLQLVSKVVLAFQWQCVRVQSTHSTERSGVRHACVVRDCSCAAVSQTLWL